MKVSARGQGITVVLLAGITGALVLYLFSTTPRSRAAPPVTPTAAGEAPEGAPDASAPALDTDDRGPVTARAKDGRSSLGATLESLAVQDPQPSDGFVPDAIYGRVVGARGAGIAAARVRLLSETRTEDPALLEAETTTDEGGRFSFAKQEPHSSARVFIEAQGFLPLGKQATAGRDTDYELQPALSVRGRLLWKDTRLPAAGGSVSTSRAHWEEGRGVVPTLEVTADGEGRFTLPMLSSKRATKLVVEAPGDSLQSFSFQASPKTQDELELLLTRDGATELEFFDVLSGNVLANTEIDLQGIKTIRTDAAGRRRIELVQNSPRNSVLTCSVKGWCATLLRGSVAGRERVRVPMLRGAIVRGVVRTQDGDPVGGVAVEVDLLSWVGSSELGLPLDDSVAIAPLPRPTRTDAGGGFEIGGLLPGDPEDSGATATVKASGPRGMLASAELFLQSHREEYEVDLVLAGGARIHGTVRCDGQGVAATVRWSDGERGGKQQTNDHGEFELLSIPAGTVSLYATLPEQLGWDNQATRELQVTQGADLACDLDLELDRASITGRVVTANGEAAQRSMVYAWATTADRHSMVFRKTKTGDDGGFELRVPEQGLLFNVGAGNEIGNVTKEGIRAGTRDLELSLPHPAELILDVRRRDTNERLKGFQLHWRTQQGEPNRYRGSKALPRPDDLFACVVVEGTLDLILQPSQQGLASTRVEGVVVRRGGNPTPTQVFVEPGVQLEIEFLNPAGHPELPPGGPPRLIPVRKAELVTEQELEAVPMPLRARRNAVAENRASYGGLAAGSWVIDGRNGLLFEPEVLAIPAVDRHTIQVRWRPAAESESEKG